MAQLGLVLVGSGLIWEGAKAFRACGLEIGIAKGTKPLGKKWGRVVGGLLIAAGLASLYIAFVVLPRM